LETKFVLFVYKSLMLYLLYHGIKARLLFAGVLACTEAERWSHLPALSQGNNIVSVRIR
jgi:hypothetical protein